MKTSRKINKSAQNMNVNEYLQRINFKGNVEINFETLRTLCIAHVQTIPYSNSCLFGGKQLSANLTDIYKKIIDDNQGGTCVELNALFSWLLLQLGFKVINGQGKFYIENEYTVPFHHLAPIVTFDDGSEYLVDVGWKMHEPVQMIMVEPQVQKNGIYRITKCGGENWYCLEKLRKTIIDDNGKIIVQGPIHEEWCGIEAIRNAIKDSTDTKIWRPICQFEKSNNELENFQHMIELWNTDPTSDLQKYLFHHKFTEFGMVQLDTNEFTVIKHVSPLLSKITKKIHVIKDKQAQEIINKYFNHDLNFKLRYYEICSLRKRESI